MAWYSLTGRENRDQELSEELSAHLEMEFEARMAKGESMDSARRNARLALGNMTGVAEATRGNWSFSLLTDLGQDMSFAYRLMRKSPVFTLAAVASLALGIGANTAIFSVFRMTLLDPLAVHAPEDLYQLAFRTMESRPDSYTASFSYPLIQVIAKEATTLSAVTCSASRQPSYRAGSNSRLIPAELVCGNLFDVLGLKPALGRLLTAEDNIKAGGHPVVVLAHHFWRSEFGGDPDVMGKTLELNRNKFTVIGVAPPTYFSMSKGNTPALFLPIVMDGTLQGGPSDTNTRQSWWIRVMLRRKPGVPADAMNAEMTALLQRDWEFSDREELNDYRKKLISSTAASVMSAERGFDTVRRERLYGKAFQLLIGVVAVVLLIACINIANLLLARATARQREISTRLAIGASRWRLVRQLLTESMALALLGGAAGLLLAIGLERVLVFEAFGRSALLSVPEVPTPRVLLTTLGLSIVAGLGFGLAPALTADRQGIRASHRITGRKLMVSFQVALSVLLLSGAGLFLQTLENLRRIDSGFRRENLLTMSIAPEAGGRSREALLGYYRNVTEALRETPGVSGVSLSSIGMLAGSQWGSGIQVAGVVIPPGEPTPLRNAVGSGFFTVIGAKLLEGRDFGEVDNRPDAAKVAIVNESFARKYFGKESALGRKIGRGAQLRPGLKDEPIHSIIGVVKDLKDSRINEAVEMYWYVPYEQQERIEGMNVNVRTSGDATQMMALLRARVAQVDPYVPISRESTMAMAVEDQIRQERLVARLSAFFAGVALLLAVVGLYGVMAYTVERRSKEIGIRMALGETRGSILWRVLRETLIYICIGAIAGVPMALGLGFAAEKLLYGVKPADWVSIGIAVMMISTFGLMAGLVSARRAASIEPMSALRIE